MESDHKSNYKNGLPANRNGVRSARPRLADLLESVTVPEESTPVTPPYTNDATVSEANSNRVDRVDSNGRDALSNTDSFATRSTESSFESSVPSNGSNHGSNSGSYEVSDWESSTSESKFDTTAFSDNDASENDLSSAALAAKKRREALYARRVEETNSAGNGHPSQDKQEQEVGSLADRLFGERQPSANSLSQEPEPQTSSVGDLPLGTSSFDSSSLDSSSSASSSPPFSTTAAGSTDSADDWTAKFSADAPLPAVSDFSTHTSGVDRALEPENLRPTAEYNPDETAPDRPTPDRPISDRPISDRPISDRPTLDRPASERGMGVESTNRPAMNQTVPTTQPTTRRFETTAPSPEELLNAVSIKGRSDGVWIELGQGKWSDVIDALSQRLVQSTGFFRGGQVTLDVGVRPLQESELREISALTQQHGLTLTSVRSRSEQSCQVALAAGLAASLDAPDGLLAQPALSNYEKLEHFVYRGNLRSGQILRRSETILVMGDVNPGSQIISDSDILIWGRLRGIAHSGASGDKKAVIAALLMEPTQLRIADAIAILPEQEAKTSLTDRLAGNASPNGVKRPEIAHAIGEDIIVDMWDESKPGGIMAFRRSL